MMNKDKRKVGISNQLDKQIFSGNTQTKILVVEDEQYSQQILERILSHAGYQVSVTSSAQEA